MDPSYSSHTGNGKLAMQAGDWAWVQDFRDSQAAQFKAELWRRLQLMPSGQRIRNLRTVLGWPQSIAAKQLRISVRTVIRHEQGRNRTPWLRLPLLERLRELESIYAEQLISYLARGGREHD
jgi:hypothetical protein